MWLAVRPLFGGMRMGVHGEKPALELMHDTVKATCLGGCH